MCLTAVFARLFFGQHILHAFVAGHSEPGDMAPCWMHGLFASLDLVILVSDLSGRSLRIHIQLGILSQLGQFCHVLLEEVLGSFNSALAPSSQP